MTHRDRSEYKIDSSVMAVCKSVTIPGMTGHVRRNTQSGAVIWELDENGRIGFVSTQIAELLDRAPADLVGQPLEELVAPAFQDNFRRALAAARSDSSIERIDLPLLHRDQEAEVPVVLRVRALKDPVHGLSGFRISTLQRMTH